MYTYNPTLTNRYIKPLKITIAADHNVSAGDVHVAEILIDDRRHTIAISYYIRDDQVLYEFTESVNNIDMYKLPATI